VNSLALLLAAVTITALSPQRKPAAPAHDVTGTASINGAAVAMTNVYAFATRTPTGQDDGTLLFFTSAPMPDDVLKTLVTAPNIVNRAKVAGLAMNGQLTAIDVYIRPLAIAEARSGTPAQTGMASTFYSKVFANLSGYTSHAGAERLVLSKSEAGAIAGTVRLALQKLSSPGGATVQYELTFKTKLRNPEK
jgi:hypothetical protein